MGLLFGYAPKLRKQVRISILIKKFCGYALVFAKYVWYFSVLLRDNCY